MCRGTRRVRFRRHSPKVGGRRSPTATRRSCTMPLAQAATVGMAVRTTNAHLPSGAPRRRETRLLFSQPRHPRPRQRRRHPAAHRQQWRSSGRQQQQQPRIRGCIRMSVFHISYVPRYVDLPVDSSLADSLLQTETLLPVLSMNKHWRLYILEIVRIIVLALLSIVSTDQYRTVESPPAGPML